MILLLILACVAKPADTGPTDSGGGEETGETGDSGETGETGETGDTGEPVASCLELVVLPAADTDAWTVDWSTLTVNLDGGKVSPRIVDGGAVYGVSLSAPEVQDALCDGAGVSPDELVGYTFFDADPMLPHTDVTLDTTAGDSLLVRIDEPSGAIHMYALFSVEAKGGETTLSVTNTSAAWRQ